MSDELGFEVNLEIPYDLALEKVIAALKVEGFGVLTRIDVQTTLKEKLGADFVPTRFWVHVTHRWHTGRYRRTAG